MAILEEILIVIAYTMVGIMTPKYGDAMRDAEMEIQPVETKLREPARHAPQQGPRVLVRGSA